MRKGKLIPISFFLFLISTVFLSCLNQRSDSDRSEIKIVSKINDSLTINIYYENSVLQAIELINSSTTTKNAIGYHKDGITPALIGNWKNSEPIGPYYTFFSNGILNCQFSYNGGEYDGNYICYSENGHIIYKAFYEEGITVDVEVNDTINFNAEIKRY